MYKGNTGSFNLFILLLAFVSLFFQYCSPSPIIQATIDENTHAYYNCTGNNTSATHSVYRSNVKTLLEWLSSNGTNNDRYYNATIAGVDAVYGVFYCKRDVDPKICQVCATEAVKLISSLCPMAKEAIIWYQECVLRYSDRRFFSTMEESPQISFMDDKDYVGDIGRFNNFVWDMLNDLRIIAANATTKNVYKSSNITDNQILYGSAWCVLYLSAENCSWCLSDAIAEIPSCCRGKAGGSIAEIPSCCRGKAGGSIMYPSCGVRFELYPFHLARDNLALVPTSRRPSPPQGKGKQKTRRIIVIVVPIVASLVLVAFGCSCFIYRKERKNRHDILKENFGNDIAALESLQLELAKIEAATNKFATENWIGKGGFGEVYKGILSDGQEIAVKRLTRSFEQGAEAFKNEVQVIAKLQHRNLVRLLGFCLEDKEKILIYEYVPNKSLDHFLHDPRKRKMLPWSQRQMIIKGIARGILYLHEDSRLKIIHRDLKPSNVLLDNDMNPRISDFGTAKIVAADHVEESTARIVGTWGYISPEYAMHGHFSVKSDVYSFGVMLLEIINGKRKGRSSEPHSDNDIRKYAWRKWIEQTPLELLDPNTEGPYSEEEVIRYTKIGLLCVQEDPNDIPTMATIMFYLNSPSVNLPFPLEPPCFRPSRIEKDMAPNKGLDKIHGSNSEITMTEFCPR